MLAISSMVMRKMKYEMNVSLLAAKRARTAVQAFRRDAPSMAMCGRTKSLSTTLAAQTARMSVNAMPMQGKNMIRKFPGSSLPYGVRVPTTV